MVAFLDLIGSAVIRGGIVLILLRLTLSMQEVLYERTEKAAMERNLSAITEVLSYDLRHVGLNASSGPFSTADTSYIRFYIDLDNNGTAEQLEYDLDYISGTSNPNLYALRRNVLGPGQNWYMAKNVTQFRLRYYDSLGVETTNLSRIRSIFVVLRMRSDKFFNGRYPSAGWQSHIFPQNL